MSENNENQRQRAKLWHIVDREFVDTEHYTGRHQIKNKVRRALEKVDRSAFVPDQNKSMAWQNHPLAIGWQQTISQPYIVALMTELLDLKPKDRVLEIGTGSGYQTAILAELVTEVYTVERITELGVRSALALGTLGYTNIRFNVADGYEGWPQYAPFDGIVVTAAPNQIPELLLEQLADGGRMVIPVGEPLGGQCLMRIEKKSGQLVTKKVLPVSFVPMLSSTK